MVATTWVKAGGLQDFMWGFGMRYAVTSGVLAAKAVLGECDYETEVRKRLVPLVRASAINRFLMNRVGNRGFKMVPKPLDAGPTQEGRWFFLHALDVKPGLLRRLLWPVVRLGMLRRKELPTAGWLVACPSGSHCLVTSGSRV
ncbi:MAG: hypothetical protein Ct9H300mP10_09340 [Methanobacteriota archaeon]|nr:MAG: hypothetical protein Ct9H300mP10_09340 [Euryarchaeota archaeon]